MLISEGSHKADLGMQSCRTMLKPTSSSGPKGLGPRDRGRHDYEPWKHLAIYIYIYIYTYIRCASFVTWQVAAGSSEPQKERLTSSLNCRNSPLVLTSIP